MCHVATCMLQTLNPMILGWKAACNLCTHTTLHTLQCNFNGKMFSFQIRKYILDLHPKL